MTVCPHYTTHPPNSSTLFTKIFPLPFLQRNIHPPFFTAQKPPHLSAAYLKEKVTKKKINKKRKQKLTTHTHHPTNKLFSKKKIARVGVLMAICWLLGVDCFKTTPTTKKQKHNRYYGYTFNQKKQPQKATPKNIVTLFKNQNKHQPQAVARLGAWLFYFCITCKNFLKCFFS